MRWLIVVALAGCNSLLGVHDFSASDAAPDAPGDAEPPLAVCSPISMLADRLSSTASLGVLWSTTATEYSVNGAGQLAIKVANSTTFGSNAYYDLTGGSFSIAIATDAAGADLEVLSQVTGNSAGFHRASNKLELRRTHSGLSQTLGSLDYDATTMKYLRFRETGGQLIYETSADGASYTVRLTTDSAALTYVHVVMTFTTTLLGATMVFLSDANGGTPSGAACPIARLADDFSAGLDKWARRYAMNGSIATDNGVARYVFKPDGTLNVMALVSSTVYDLRDGALAFEIPRMVDTTTDQAVVAIVQARAQRNVAELVQQKGKLTASLERDGSGVLDVVSSTDYDATADRWWRFAATQTSLSWEVSPDGATWHPLAVADTLSGLDNLEVIVAAQGSASVATEANLDNVGGP